MATLGLGLVALLWPSRSFRLANKNSKAKRVSPSMIGGEDTLGLLEEDIVVHESWWCCGPQIAVEEDMVVKLGPLVAVVVVEAAACCLLSAACPSHMIRHHACLCLLPYKTATSALPIVGLRHNEGKLWATASFAGWSSPRASSLAKVVVAA